MICGLGFSVRGVDDGTQEAERVAELRLAACLVWRCAVWCAQTKACIRGVQFGCRYATSTTKEWCSSGNSHAHHMTLSPF